MGVKDDRIMVTRDFPLQYMKANRLYILGYSNTIFIGNGNIYVKFVKYPDKSEESMLCCSIHNLKKWGGIERLKRFVSLKGKKERVKTIQDLIDAVMECGYKREIDCSEYYEIQKETLLQNSDYKYKLDKLCFHNKEEFRNRFETIKPDLYRDIDFRLDLVFNGKCKQDLSQCIRDRIEHEANQLLEKNFIKPEDINKVKFCCYVEVRMSHSWDYENGNHVFYRYYKFLVGIDKINEYYNNACSSLSEKDVRCLSCETFHLSDYCELRQAFDEYMKNIIFA